MRDYGKVSPQFWIGKTGKELRRAGYQGAAGICLPFDQPACKHDRPILHAVNVHRPRNWIRH